MALKSLVISSTSSAPGPPNVASDSSNDMPGCGRARKIQGVRRVSRSRYLLDEGQPRHARSQIHMGDVIGAVRMLLGRYVNIGSLPQNQIYHGRSPNVLEGCRTPRFALLTIRQSGGRGLCTSLKVAGYSSRLVCTQGCNLTDSHPVTQEY